jgi:hypothetical protein
MDLGYWMGDCGLDSFGTGQGPMSGSCNCSNEPTSQEGLCSIKLTHCEICCVYCQETNLL